MFVAAQQREGYIQPRVGDSVFDTSKLVVVAGSEMLNHRARKVKVMCHILFLSTE